MKKYLKIMLYAALAGSMTMFTACGDEEDSLQSIDEPVISRFWAYEQTTAKSSATIVIPILFLYLIVFIFYCRGKLIICPYICY